MAIAPTGRVFKALSFDGTSSRSFGVYITGEAVYNAPERDVEMITIPGRNGTFALDNGRFQNITVSYPAGIYADTEDGFRQAVSNFRNFLCSKQGYCRLEDEYNPDEYRMAVYKSGLEVTPAMKRSGEFTITFECKPQRWLTSGEQEIEVASGDTITNPTPFESGPLIKAWDYGTIGMGGHTIEIENAVMGNVIIADSKETTVRGYVKYFDNILFNDGDEIRFEGMQLKWTLMTAGAEMSSISSITDTNSDFSTTYTGSAGSITAITQVQPLTFTAGTNHQVSNVTVLTGTRSGVTVYIHITTKVTYRYNATAGSSSITVDISWTSSNSNVSYYFEKLSITGITGNSSVSILGNPTYIDCDLGEAYKIVSGSVISLNAYIDLGSTLPALNSGANAITLDNTITQLKIVPRWWKV